MLFLSTWKAEQQRHRAPCMYWFTSQILTTARARAGPSQEPEPPSAPPTWVAGARVSDPSSAASRDAVAGSWVGSRVTTPQTALHVGCRQPEQQPHPLGCRACPWIYRFLSCYARVSFLWVCVKERCVHAHISPHLIYQGKEEWLCFYWRQMF